MSKIIQKIKSIRWQQFFMILLMAAVVAGADGCKSTGKMSKKQRKAEIEQAKKQVQSIISGTSTLSLDEQKHMLATIMDKNYNDPTLDSMIVEAQKKLKDELAEYNRTKMQRVDEARAKLYDLLVNKDNKTADELEKELSAIRSQNLKDQEIDELMSRLDRKIKSMRASGEGTGTNLTVKSQLEMAFSEIVTNAKTGNLTQADNVIRKTLPLFASDETPVLIIISREGTQVDYDKPTSIKRYLQLLKDTKANKNGIDAIINDDNGKIKELDLIKKQ